MFSFWVNFKSITGDGNRGVSYNTGGFLTYADTAEQAVLRCLKCNIHKITEITAVYKEVK